MQEDEAISARRAPRDISLELLPLEPEVPRAMRLASDVGVDLLPAKPASRRGEGDPAPLTRVGQPGQTTLISPRLLEPERSSAVQLETQAKARIKPPVGWLVIVGGPGRGQVHTLSYGMNPVGSHVEQGFQLNFGDLQIADVQAVILYDHQRRKFFLHPKGGRVATFLSGEPVLKLTPLAAHQEIMMGRTRLRFVPLCGSDFDWTQK